jgi:hypothetical protein
MIDMRPGIWVTWWTNQRVRRVALVVRVNRSGVAVKKGKKKWMVPWSMYPDVISERRVRELADEEHDETLLQMLDGCRHPVSEMFSVRTQEFLATLGVSKLEDLSQVALATIVKLLAGKKKGSFVCGGKGICYEIVDVLREHCLTLKDGLPEASQTRKVLEALTPGPVGQRLRTAIDKYLESGVTREELAWALESTVVQNEIDEQVAFVRANPESLERKAWQQNDGGER